MSIRALLRRAALCAAAPMLLMAVAMPEDDTRTRETDVAPTEADHRFRAKYGIWPPHITYEKRSERERARVANTDKHQKVKKEKTSVKPERERQ